MSALERLRAVGAALLVVAALVVVLLPGTAPRAEAATSSSSAVTVNGTGDFSSLAVTVSKTTHLRNQVVDVTWKGGAPTLPTTGTFAFNYLQIFQCWGDGAEPVREQCQFGGLTGDARGGAWASGRQVTYGDTLVDPLETYLSPGRNEVAYVPFTSVTGVTTTAVRNDFYDSYTTNEIPFARTYADGTGREHFEVQTAKEAPGLGCGQATSSGKPRSCWLVVVPRGRTEVNGVVPSEDLDSSPLSMTNWKNRISVPLQFDPVALQCPIGSAERPIRGQESVVEAISRWQPALCSATRSIFSFLQMSDDLARQQVLGDDPQLSIVTRPVAPDAITDGRALVYAPVAASGLGISFNIDRQVARDAPADVKAKAGTRVEQLKLTPRLVAKLLTQSYKGASLRPDLMPVGNPRSLALDPEFLSLNPEFKDLDIRTLTRIVVPTGLSDAYAELWAWLARDPQVQSFLSGQPDEGGMVVNPAYKGLLPSLENFPVQDLRCRPADGEIPELCPLDYLAYSADLHEAARAAARGQTLSRSVFTPNGAGWKVEPPQLSGTRAVLALTDTATADLFGLPMAALQTGADQFATPTQAAMAKALDHLVDTEVKGVQTLDPKNTDATVYPLTHVSYGVTAPEKLTASAARSYGAFLRYSARQGQVAGGGPGQLPAGYVPLPKQLRDQTLAAAAVVSAGPGPSPRPTAAPSDGSSGGVGPGDSGGVPGSNDPATTPDPETSATPGSTRTVAATAPVSFTTPADPRSASRWVVVLALLAGALLLAGRPALTVYWRHRRAAP